MNDLIQELNQKTSNNINKEHYLKKKITTSQQLENDRYKTLQVCNITFSMIIGNVQSSQIIVRDNNPACC